MLFSPLLFPSGAGLLQLPLPRHSKVLGPTCRATGNCTAGGKLGGLTLFGALASPHPPGPHCILVPASTPPERPRHLLPRARVIPEAGVRAQPSAPARKLCPQACPTLRASLAKETSAIATDVPAVDPSPGVGASEPGAWLKVPHTQTGIQGQLAASWSTGRREVLGLPSSSLFSLPCLGRPNFPGLWVCCLGGGHSQGLAQLELCWCLLAAFHPPCPMAAPTSKVYLFEKQHQPKVINVK